MKLHLPSALRRSLLSCLMFAASAVFPTLASGGLLAGSAVAFFMAQQQALAVKENLTSDVTTRDGVEYAGRIFTLTDPDNHGALNDNEINLLQGTFTYEGDAKGDNGSGFTILGDAAGGPGGATGADAAQDNNRFAYNTWTRDTTGDTSVGSYGHTLRLADGLAGKTIRIWFGDFSLGGLIVEASAANSTLYAYAAVSTASRDMFIEAANNKETQFTIKGNFGFTTNKPADYAMMMDFKSNANWVLSDGVTLTIGQNINLKVEDGKTVYFRLDGTTGSANVRITEMVTTQVTDKKGLGTGVANKRNIYVASGITLDLLGGLDLSGVTNNNNKGIFVENGARLRIHGSANFGAGYGIQMQSGSGIVEFVDTNYTSTGTFAMSMGTYEGTGMLTINGGTLKLYNNAVVTLNGGLTLNSGGTYNFEGTNNNSALTVAGRLVFNGGTLAMNNVSTLNLTCGNTGFSIGGNTGSWDLAAGKLVTDGNLVVEDNFELTISSTGTKTLGGNINLAGENSRMVVKTVQGYAGSGGVVTGQGVLVYDFDNLENGLGGCIDVTGYSGAPYTLGGEAGRFISATAGEMLKELRLAEGTVLSTTYILSGNKGAVDSSQQTKFNNISRLVVEDGAAFALRAFDNTTFGSSANTLVLAGEAEIQSSSGQAAKNNGVYRGSLLVGADAMLNGNALHYNLNSNIEMLSDTGVFVALSSRDNDLNKYTLTLGSAADSGSLKANGHVLTKRGGGILELGQYFKTAEGDTGVFDVQEGTLKLAYAEPTLLERPDEMWDPVLAGYVVRLGDAGHLQLGISEANERGYVIQSLGGSGVLELEDSSPGLIIRNQLTTDTANNSFTGTIKVESSQTLNLTLESGYQRLAAAIERVAGTGTEADFALAAQVNGGVLDLTGFDDNREAGAAISVTIGSSNARVEGLVLNSGDVLDLNSQAVSFHVTMKGGSLLNSDYYTGIVTIDDSKLVEAGTYAKFDLGNLNSAARVTVHALSAGATDGSYVSVNQRLTLTGNNTISLGDYVQEGHAGFEDGMFKVVTSGGSLTMVNGATLTVNIANILDSITAEGVNYRISNRSIDSIFDQMSFGAELSIFNVKVEKGDTPGSLRFSALKADWDHVYQATDNNDGSEWHAGNDVYASTEPYTAVYIDRDTDVDLRGASMGSHKDGLVLKNLTGSENGELTIEGDGKGRSLVTICNNLTDAQLKALSDEMGVEVINTLTYLGNITLNNADLQVKHLENDSTTHMVGRLALQGDSTLMMTSGVLELSCESNDLGSGGVSFAGNNSQLHLNGGSTRLSGNISLDQPVGDADPNAVQHEQHIRLSDGAELQLAGSTTVAAGITIGHDDDSTANGTLSVLSDSAMGAGAVVKNVMLYLAEGSHLSVNPAADVQPLAAQKLEPGAEWAVQGIVGSGKLSSAVLQDMTVTVRKQDCTFSGDLSGYNGTMTLQGGDHAQVFSGVLGGAGWNLHNTAGSSLVLDLMGERSLNSLQFGSLSLDKGSTTSVLMNLADAVSGKGLNMEHFDYNSGASVTVGHYQGSVRLDAADGSDWVDLVLGHVDSGTSFGKDLSNWVVTGVRNAKDGSAAEVYVDENGTIHARVIVDNANKWVARTEGENAGAGANLLWGVKDTGAVGGDLAALDSRINSLIGGSNWQTPGNAEEASRILAAAAGASTAVLGQAIASDVDRQMRTIRNRTTSMGYTELDTPQSAELPHWSAWLNAESYYHTQKEDGLMPGYKLNSWGGTVGAHVDTDTDTTLGLALTAMYGDLESQGPDTLKGDLATYYVSGFARMASGAWLHTVVCTVGLAQLDADRTVRYDESAAYTTSGSTQGWSLGLMYEVGYSIAMNEYGTVCLQPVANVAWRYTMLNAYTETGSTAALDVDKQTYSSLTFGMGARMQSTMGDRVFNGAGLLEARALLKLELGDRQGESSVSFARAAGSSATVKGSERGVAGLELGAGVCLPVSDAGSEIFADVSAEVRSNATELNATLGYRFSF